MELLPAPKEQDREKLLTARSRALENAISHHLIISPSHHHIISSSHHLIISSSHHVIISSSHHLIISSSKTFGARKACVCVFLFMLGALGHPFFHRTLVAHCHDFQVDTPCDGLACNTEGNSTFTSAQNIKSRPVSYSGTSRGKNPANGVRRCTHHRSTNACHA
jgi:hypothetical protein